MVFILFTGKRHGAGFPILRPVPDRFAIAVTGGLNFIFFRGRWNCTAFIFEMLPADFAHPVFLGSIHCAGGIFLWRLYHLAMRHCQCARGANSTAVRSCGGNRGVACAYGSHCSIFTYRGNAGVAAFPSYILIGGIRRLYGNGQGIAVFFL